MLEIVKEWVSREIKFYTDTSVEPIDILIGHIRISYIFNTPAKEISADFIFGEHLKSSFEALFAANELDQIYFDIEDMVLGLTTKDLGIQVIAVKDYVTLLSRLRMSQNLNYYKKLVGEWLDVICATKFGCKLKKWTGFLPKRYIKEHHSELIDFVREYIQGRKAVRPKSAGQNRHEIEGETSGGKMKSSPLRRKE